MKKNYIMMTFVAVLIFGSLLIIGLDIKKQESAYKSFESDLKEAAEAFYKINDTNLAPDQEKKITIKELLDAKLIESLDVNDDTCDGYVNILKKRKEFIYTVHIKCNDYETAEE